MGTIISVFGKVAASYKCPACGHKEVAYVQAAGSGTGFSASREVEDGAYRDQYKNAERLANCVPCPECGAVNRAHRNRLRNLALLAGLGWNFGLLLVTWLFMGANTDANTLWAMAIIGGGMGLMFSLPMYLTLRSRWWAGVKEKVVFESQLEQDEQESEQPRV